MCAPNTPRCVGTSPASASQKAMARAVACAPDRAYYVYRLGEVHHLLGERAEVARLFSHAVKLAADDPFYHYKLGELHFRQGRLDEATVSYEAACRHAPADDFYHIRLAVAYARQEQHERALAIFRRAILIEPRNPAYRFLLAEQLALMGFEEYAQEQYRVAGRLDQYDQDYVQRVRSRFGADLRGENDLGDEGRRGPRNGG